MEHGIRLFGLLVEGDLIKFYTVRDGDHRNLICYGFRARVDEFYCYVVPVADLLILGEIGIGHVADSARAGCRWTVKAG